MQFVGQPVSIMVQKVVQRAHARSVAGETISSLVGCSASNVASLASEMGSSSPYYWVPQILEQDCQDLASLGICHQDHASWSCL